MSSPTTCIFCLSRYAMEIRYDKHARPYLACRICQARAFLRSIDGARGAGIVPYLIDRALEQRECDPVFREQFDAKVSAFIQEVKVNSLTPPSREPVMGLPQQRLPEPYVPGQVPTREIIPIP